MRRRSLVLTSTLVLTLSGLAPVAAADPVLAERAGVTAAEDQPVAEITAVNGTARLRVNWWTTAVDGSVAWTVPADPRITGFAVLVNGAVAAEYPADARRADLRHVVGENRVVVRTRLGDATTDSVHRRIFLDTQAPAFRHPTRVELGAGPVSTSRVPMRLPWNVSDDTGLGQGWLREGSWYRGLTHSGPAHRTLADSGVARFTATPGAHTWTATVEDRAGRETARTWERAVEVRGERLGTHTGGWTTRTSSGYTHGTAMRSDTEGAEVTLTTTAQAIGWVSWSTPGTGAVRVYVDGRYEGTYGTATDRRGSNVSWTRTWPYTGTHTVRVVVVDPERYGPVTSDGFTVLR